MEKKFHDLLGNEITEKQYNNIQTNKKLLPILGGIIVISIVYFMITSDAEVEKPTAKIENTKNIDLATATLQPSVWFTCKDKYRDGVKVFDTKVYVDNSLLVNGTYYKNIGRNTWANNDKKFRINTQYDDMELIIDNGDKKTSVYCNFQYQ